MAQSNPKLIEALRVSADQIASGERYEWGHMGSCNCGYLAQNLTQLSRHEIHERAICSREGDWAEQATDYCPDSLLPIDQLIAELMSHGLTPSDISDLEKLANPRVVRMMDKGFMPLRRNQREHAIAYMRTWADLLEQELR